MTQTIEQLQAKVAELEAEVERLSVAHVKACQANADSQAELAKAEQRVAEACALYIHSTKGAVGSINMAEAVLSGKWRKFVKEA